MHDLRPLDLANYLEEKKLETVKTQVRWQSQTAATSHEILK